MRIQCPLCGQRLRGDASLTGTNAKCPSCEGVFLLQPPDETAREDDPLVGEASERLGWAEASSEASPRTKRCPYCGEEILEIARKCKHCSEWLDGSPGPDYVQVLEEKPLAPGAVASFVWALVGLLLLGLVLGVVAIAYAVKAKRHIREHPGRYRGGGFASAGMVIGIIEIGVSLLYIVLLMMGAA